VVMVYRFKVYDLAAGEFVEQPRKASAEHVRSVGGIVIHGTAEVVEASALDSAGLYTPHPRKDRKTLPIWGRHHPNGGR
jgi:hypothetical protein